jgi:hypothetical protein
LLSPLLLVAVERHHRPSNCLACRVALPLCKPKSINMVVTGNTSRRLNQINSHGINRHQHRHSWAFVFVAGNTSLVCHQINHREQIPLAHSRWLYQRLFVASVCLHYCWCFVWFIPSFISTAAASYPSCCHSCSC